MTAAVILAPTFVPRPSVRVHLVNFRWTVLSSHPLNPCGAWSILISPSGGGSTVGGVLERVALTSDKQKHFEMLICMYIYIYISLSLSLSGRVWSAGSPCDSVLCGWLSRQRPAFGQPLPTHSLHLQAGEPTCPTQSTPKHQIPTTGIPHGHRSEQNDGQQAACRRAFAASWFRSLLRTSQL